MQHTPDGRQTRLTLPTFFRRGVETASFSTFREKHTSLSSELALLKEEAAALQASHDLLERRVAIGEYDPRSFRCLQLELNPSTMDLAIRTATLEALRAENAALIDQLRREGGTDAAAAGGVGGDGGGVVPRETYDRVMKERQEEKAQMEKRLMRLKEVRSDDRMTSSLRRN